MKIVVTGTRGIPGIMGGVETHCEELFPRIARKGFDVTVIRRKSYVHDTLRQYEGITLVDLATPKKKSFEAIVHTFRAVLEAKKLKADIIHIHAVGRCLCLFGFLWSLLFVRRFLFFRRWNALSRCRRFFIGRKRIISYVLPAGAEGNRHAGSQQ